MMIGGNRDNNLPLLEVRNLSFSWGAAAGFQVLKSCSFSIPRSGLWMLVGRNGSGKSTLFRLISGMLTPQSGEIISQLKPALMFQNPDHQLLMPTCGSDLLLSTPITLPNEARQRRIKIVLEQVGLMGMESRPIHTLSGGQKQRLALAGALASDANLLLLDEPTALLDPESQIKVLKIVKSLCTRKNNPMTAIWITHRLQELNHCDGAARLEKGQVGTWHSGFLLKKFLKPLAGRVV